MYEQTDCIVCGETPPQIHPAFFAPFVSKRIFDYNGRMSIRAAYCPSCHTSWTVDRLDDAEMSKLYTNYRDQEYLDTRIALEPNYGKHEEFVKTDYFYEERMRILDHVFKDEDVDASSIKSVLDYGGDSGKFIPKIFDNCEKYLYDVSGATPVEGVAVWDGETTVDFTMICHVLEHVSDPAKLLEEVKATVNEGGYIYVETPIQENPPLPNGQFHEHINAFSPDGILKMFERTGIAPIVGNTHMIPVLGHPCFSVGILGRV